MLLEVPLLHTSDEVGVAARRLIDSGLPALPVVDDDDRLKGIFGERELLEAAMPGYLRTMRSASFVKKGLDPALELNEACIHEPVERWMNAEHVEVEEGFSEAQAAETFLHHRVLMLPIVDSARRVQGVVLRSEFARAIGEHLLGGD